MASNTPKANRPSEVTALQKMSDGLTKHASTIPQLVIGAVSMTPADVSTKLESRIAVAQAVDSTRATWRNAVAVDDTATEQLKPFLSGLRQTLLAAFSGQVDVLADFGLTPRKKAVLTTTERAAAALKAKATRAARGTLGKNQKADITTNVKVNAATVTPMVTVPAPAPEAPATTSTTAAPAPVAAPVTEPVVAPVTTTAPATSPAPVAAPTPASPTHS